MSLDYFISFFYVKQPLRFSRWLSHQLEVFVFYQIIVSFNFQQINLSYCRVAFTSSCQTKAADAASTWAAAVVGQIVAIFALLKMVGALWWWWFHSSCLLSGVWEGLHEPVADTSIAVFWSLVFEEPKHNRVGTNSWNWWKMPNKFNSNNAGFLSAALINISPHTCAILLFVSSQRFSLTLLNETKSSNYRAGVFIFHNSAAISETRQRRGDDDA